MNLRIASFLTALLFLATPLAILTPAVSAQGLSSYSCPAPGSDPDFVHTALCNAAVAVGAAASGDFLRTTICTPSAPGSGAIVDKDRDGRPDGYCLRQPAPINQRLVIPIDVFFDDANPSTNDQLYDLDATVPFDVSVDPRLILQLSGTAPVADRGGNFRLSNAFTHQVRFTDGRLHSAETYAIALYAPGDEERFASSGYTGEPLLAGRGICVICVNPSAMRLVFSDYGVQTSPYTEGVIDIDAVPGDASIQPKNGPYNMHLRATQGRNLPPSYPDNKNYRIQEAFLRPGAPDIDDDGFADSVELSCNSNPTHPRSTCNDVDGDGLANDVDGDPFVPLGDIDGDGIPDTLDKCPTVRDVDQKDFNGDGRGDACTDQDQDGLFDDTELLGTANPFCSMKANGVSVRKTAGCPTDEPSLSGATSPTVADSDGDGLTDGSELLATGIESRGVGNPPAASTLQPTTTERSDPNNADSDKDGLSDPLEDTANNGRGKGNPTLADTDADGRLDPADNCIPTANTNQFDIDADGIGDACEAADTQDMDGDGISNKDERDVYCTAADNPDTDGDGLTDGQEINDNKRTVSRYAGVTPPQGNGPHDFVRGCLVGTARVPVVYAFLDPNKPDSDGDGTMDNPDNIGNDLPSLVRVPGATPSGLFPTSSPLGVAANVDEYDPRDVNDDKKGNQFNEATGKYDVSDRQANGQIDIIERNVFFYDPDESVPQASYGRFEGVRGVTMTAYHGGNGKGPSTVVRLGDVANTNQVEAFVIESSRQLGLVSDDFATLCGVIEHDRLVLYSNVVASTPQVRTNSVRFAEDTAKPCGEPATKAELQGIANALGDPFWLAPFYTNDPGSDPWFIVNDADGDGSPESISIRLPDPSKLPCDFLGIIGECGPADYTEIPLGPSPGDLDAAIDGLFEELGIFAAFCDSEAGTNSLFCIPELDAAPLSAGFANQPYEGQVGQAVAIKGVPSDTSALCSWSGPGATFADANACETTATYTTAGRHALFLLVTQGTAKATRSAPITITMPPPLTADAGGPYTGSIGQAIAITGVPSGGAGGPHACAWSGSGATFASASNCATTVSFSSAGSKTITLTVTEGTQSVSDSAAVTVTAPPAIGIDAGGPYKGYTGTDIAIDSTITNALNTPVCTWSGEGATFTPATACDTVVKFTTGGSKTISVTVVDGTDATRTATDTATVDVKALESMPGGPYAGSANAPIAISGFARNATAADVSCLWSGTGATFDDASKCATNVTYTSAGSKVLSLKVTNGTVEDTNTTTVEVAPEAAFAAEAGGPYSGNTGQAIAIAGSANRAPSAYTCAWTSDDGATFANAASCGTTVTFAAAGSKSLTLTVTHATLGTATDTATVTVTDPPEPTCAPMEDIFPDCLIEEIEDQVDPEGLCDPSAQISICLREQGWIGQQLGLPLPGADIKVRGVFSFSI